jgi:hypothetical protein
MWNRTFFCAALATAFFAATAGAAHAQRVLGQDANSATIVQTGSGHAAGVVQTGQNNDASLGQTGRNNTGQIVQNGDNNTACLYQHGRDLNGAITQVGDNQTTAWVQTRGGWHPVPVHVCTGQVNGGRGRDFRNSRVRLTSSALRGR